MAGMGPFVPPPRGTLSSFSDTARWTSCCLLTFHIGEGRFPSDGCARAYFTNQRSGFFLSSTDGLDPFRVLFEVRSSFHFLPQINKYIQVFSRSERLSLTVPFIFPTLSPRRSRDSNGVGYTKDLTMKMKKKPLWLESLLGTKFFGLCEDHKDLRKSEMNTYCTDCDEKVCQHCLLSPKSANLVHVNHRLLQIRRYVYQDVVRIHDIHKLLDCSKIQPFIVNGAKVILLNPKKNSKAFHSSIRGCHVCQSCGRTITDPNQYCSISCKVISDGDDDDDDDDDAVDECHQNSDSVISSVTADLGNSNSWQSLNPTSEEYCHDCCKEEEVPPMLKRKRKGVPRRSFLY